MKHRATVYYPAIRNGGRLILVRTRGNGRLTTFSIPSGTFVGRLAFTKNSAVVSVTITSSNVHLLRFGFKGKV